MKRTIAVTVMGVAMMLMGAHVRADDAQSRCAQIGQKWVDFWNDGDVTKAFDVFTKDIVYEDVTLGLHFSGADEFKAFASPSSSPSPFPALSWGRVLVAVIKGFSNGPGSPRTAT